MTFPQGKKTVYIDIEANGLDEATIIHCIVCKDKDTGEWYKFRPRSRLGGHTEWGKDFIEFSETVDTYIGHNIIGYDARVIKKLLGVEIPIENIIDTLVLSRLFRPVTPDGGICREKGYDNRIGGHSLEAWGNRLGEHKGEFNEWEAFSERMLDYCTQDVTVLEKIYNHLMNVESEGFSPESIRLEHEVAYYLREMEANGFHLDKDKASKMKADTQILLNGMLEELRTLFPTKKKPVSVYTPRYTKDGILNKVSQRIISNPLAEKNADGTYTIHVMEEFNPGSPNQVVDRLLSLGWSPTKLTPAGKPSADKESLAKAIQTLAHIPAVRALGKYNIIANRNEKATKWLELVKEDGRVHGHINPIGAGTHRCAHYDDNMANIAKVVTDKMDLDKFISKYGEPSVYGLFQQFDSDKLFIKADSPDKKEPKVEFVLCGLAGGFGWESRDCWCASSEDTCIVGADASGIQLRALAHYMNDPIYIDKLLNADIHVVNQEAAGLPSRSKAKTFIYAWIMGAGDEKIGGIVGVLPEEYEELFAWAKREYARNYISKEREKQNLFAFTIDTLRKNGRKADKKTVAIILKGRRTKDRFLDSLPELKRFKTKDIPAAAKQGYMVGLDGRKIWVPSEHLAMPAYLQGFEVIVMKKAIILTHKKLTELGVPFKLCAMVHDELQIECKKEYAETVGKIVVWAIREAGRLLGSNCPLDGEYKIGRSWAETH